MSIQDVGFLVVLCLLVFKRSPTLSVFVGALFLLLSLVNFALLVSFRDPVATLSHFRLGFLKLGFFTAERLTWYAAAFFLLAVFLYLVKIVRK